MNLATVRVPFAITLRNCSIPEVIDLTSTTIGNLDLSGSYTGPIHARLINVADDLVFGNGFHAAGQVILGGTGRTIPLTHRACATLALWLSRFPRAMPEAFVFPAYRIGGNSQGVLYGVDLSRPVGSWKRAWRDVLSSARLHNRWHDLRHTFVSRLAENPAVSEQTIMAMVGHVSKSMLARYSHIRATAKQVAINALEAGRTSAKAADFETRSRQNPPQSELH